jgi:hypothetical protein
MLLLLQLPTLVLEEFVLLFELLHQLDCRFCVIIQLLLLEVFKILFALMSLFLIWLI